MKELLLLTISVILLLCLPVKGADNLLTNGDFETIGSDGLPLGWVYEEESSSEYKGTNEYAACDTAYSGSTSVKYWNTNGTGSTNGSIKQRILVNPGDTFKFTFYYNVLSAPWSDYGSLSANVYFLNVGGVALGSTVADLTYTSSTLGEWTPKQVKDLIAPDNAYYLLVQFNATYGPSFLIDKANLTKTGNGMVTSKTAQVIYDFNDTTITYKSTETKRRVVPSAHLSSGLDLSYRVDNDYYSETSCDMIWYDAAGYYVYYTPGTDRFIAYNEGDDTYAPVADTIILTVQKAPNTISVDSITLGVDDVVKIDYSVVSDDNTTFSISDKGIASIVNNKYIKGISAGTTYLTVSSCEGTCYEGKDTTISVTVYADLEDQTLNGVEDMTFSECGELVKLGVSASSGLSVTYSIVNDNSENNYVIVGDISNDTLIITNTGQCYVVATQKGNSQYRYVTDSMLVKVTGYGSPDIVGLSDLTVNYSDSPVSFSAKILNGASVYFESSNTDVATIDVYNGTVNLDKPGTSTITAYHDEDYVCFTYGETTATLTVVDDGTYMGTSSVSVENETTSNNNYMSIFPNPVNGQTAHLILGAACGGKISVYTLSGSLLLKTEAEAGKSNMDMDISLLSEGLYMVKFEANNGKTSLVKLIK